MLAENMQAGNTLLSLLSEKNIVFAFKSLNSWDLETTHKTHNSKQLQN